jgi:opacity protein-like surface antigen
MMSVGLAVILSASLASAQNAAPQAIEVFGGLTLGGRGQAARLATSYSPPLLPVGEFSSHGGQTLLLEPQGGAGFEGGINVLLTRHFGFQLAASRTVADLDGTNGPYSVDITYVSRQPPDSTPQTFTIHESVPWPDTTGSASLFTASANGLVRVKRSDRLSATVLAGVGVGRLDGTTNQVGYTTFRMGGHAVMFSDEYRVAVSLGPTTLVGFNLGGDIDVPISRRTAVVVGYRYFEAAAKDVSVGVSSILNAGEVANQETVESIAQHLGLGSVRLASSGSRFLVGVNITR